MNNPKKILLIAVVIVITGFTLWFFSSLVIYLITSVMLSFIGSPLVRLMRKIRIGKYLISYSTCAAITLVLIICFFGAIIITVFPAILSQANLFSEIDINSLTKNLEDKLQPFEQHLIQYKLLTKDQKIITLLTNQVYSFIRLIDFTQIMNNILSLTGNIFVGLFAVLFTTFFLLKDEHLAYNFVMLVAPVKYHPEMQNILTSSKNLLSRYFIGLCLELILITSCYAITLSIFGIKNALLIAFIGGMLHVIPYLGPLIGGTIGVLLGVASALATTSDVNITPVILIILGTFIAINILDNILFQPFIYSNSVKAHPLEIFFVVLIGDNIAGIPGMILAIPIYTLLRIILKEFLNRFRIVQKLTERL
jgi:predicted PurR-regulated permease PerM